jgi:hypothetical protein
LIGPLTPLLITQVPVVLLNKPSADYFFETREKMFGKPLDQVRKEADEDECWEKAKAPAKEAGDLLRKNGGPYFLGETGKCTRPGWKFQILHTNSWQSPMPTSSSCQ